MPTCQDIIRSAYRRSGILAAGVNMNASQSAIGLEHLQGLYQNLISGGMFGRAKDYFLDGVTYEAKEGQRVFKSQPATVTLPITVRDECTGQMRQPRDGAFVTIVDPVLGVPSQNIYDRSIGQWVEITDLGLQDPAPLSGRYEDHLKNMLAVKMLGDVDLPMPLELIRSEGRARLALATRPDGERSTGRGEYS